MADLSVQVEASFAEIENLREEWDRFVLEVGSDVHSSFDYCRVWWDVFGFKRKLHILLFRKEGRLAGILPLLIDRIQLGPAWLHVARFLGSDLCREIFIPAVKPSDAVEVYGETLRILFDDERCDALVWGCYSSISDSSDALRKACSSHADQVTLEKDTITSFPHSNFFLSDTFEEYFRSLTHRRRNDYRRYMKRIQDRGDLKVTLIRDAEGAVSEFSKFRDLYDRFNQFKGRPGHFLGQELREKFWLALCEELGARGGIRLLRLSTERETIDYEYCLKFGSGYFWKYRVRAFGPEWDGLGVGDVALVELMKAAIEEKVTRVEAGPGHFDYKVGYGASEPPIGSMLFVANRPWVKRRYRVFKSLVSLLDLVYLKFWYLNLRRRLRLPPRPRCNLWFRTRL